jgi:hypothetical protein
MGTITLGLKRNRIYVAEPHPASLAALILLNTQLSREMLDEWFSFRDRFLAKFPVLVCHYCGKTPLTTEVDDPSDKRKLHWLATLDHVNPRDNGGGEYDEDNLVIACFPCNNKKGNKLLPMVKEKNP